MIGSQCSESREPWVSMSEWDWSRLFTESKNDDNHVSEPQNERQWVSERSLTHQTSALTEASYAHVIFLGFPEHYPDSRGTEKLVRAGLRE